MDSSVFKANLFALFLVLLQVLAPIFLRPLIYILGYGNVLISDEYIFLLLPCIIFIIINGSALKKTLSIRKLSLIDILIVILIAILCQPIAGFLSELSGMFFSNPVTNAFNRMSSLSLVFMLFFMAVTPAICEESVTRGAILYGYRNKNIFAASIANGLIFGILHLSPQQFLYAFVLGAIFVYLVRITGSIFASMLCHFSFNGIQVVASRAYIGKGSSETSAMLKNGANQTQLLIYQLCIALIFFVAIIILIRYLYSLHRNDEHFQIAKDVSYERKQKISFLIEYSPLIILLIIYVLLMMKNFI